MTPTEAAALLAVAAAFDNRKPDSDAAQAWAFQLDGLPFQDCRDAIMAHYRTSSEWLMPKDVISAVRRVRDKRIAEAGDLTPPRGLTDPQERAWLADARRRLGDGETLEDVHGDRKPHPELAAKVRELFPRPDERERMEPTNRSVDTTEPDECERCDGTGLLRYPQPHPDDTWADQVEPCPSCRPDREGTVMDEMGADA